MTEKNKLNTGGIAGRSMVFMCKVQKGKSERFDTNTLPVG